MAKSRKAPVNSTETINVHNLTLLQSRGLENTVKEKLGFGAKTFVILRHPLARFLSAYSDKMSLEYADKFNQTEWYKLWTARRKHVLKYFGKFENARKPYSVGLKDFISFVTRNEGRDSLAENEHWKLQEDICGLCSNR